jgi:hypothetical protein
MIICYNTHINDPDKPELMPASAVWHVYEFEDDNHSSIADLVSQGYVAATPAEYAAYVSSIDMTAYNASLLPTLQEVFSNTKAALINMFDEIEETFEAEITAMGINPPFTGMVVQYLHFMDHYMEVGAWSQVLVEIDRLLAAGVPPELAPFVTAERLTVFKNKILAGLADLQARGII